LSIFGVADCASALRVNIRPGAAAYVTMQLRRSSTEPRGTRGTILDSDGAGVHFKDAFPE
jgi:hypothetical protein